MKGSKHSLQCHPHDAALVNAHSFVSMGLEAVCCPCHSAAHCRLMKSQPSLCHCRPCRGRRHCDCHCCCHCHCWLCYNPNCCCPLLLPLPLAFAVAVAVNYCRRRLCHVAVGHHRCHCPHCRPLPSPSPLAIAVAISVGHHRCHHHQPLPRVVALVH